MTFAPERPGGDALRPAARRAGASSRRSGHTDADADTAWAALRSALDCAPRGGRPLVTHVFNGMPPLHHRAPGPVAAAWPQAARARPSSRSSATACTSPPRRCGCSSTPSAPTGSALITDAMAASGMPEGRYTLGGRDVVVDGRTARLADGGSHRRRRRDPARGRPLVRPARRASRCATRSPPRRRTPAARPGPPRRRGPARRAARADVLVVDDDLRLRSVLRAGQWLG